MTAIIIVLYICFFKQRATKDSTKVNPTESADSGPGRNDFVETANVEVHIHRPNSEVAEQQTPAPVKFSQSTLEKTDLQTPASVNSSQPAPTKRFSHADKDLGVESVIFTQPKAAARPSSPPNHDVEDSKQRDQAKVSPSSSASAPTATAPVSTSSPNVPQSSTPVPPPSHAEESLPPINPKRSTLPAINSNNEAQLSLESVIFTPPQLIDHSEQPSSSSTLPVISNSTALPPIQESSKAAPALNEDQSESEVSSLSESEPERREHAG